MTGFWIGIAALVGLIVLFTIIGAMFSTRPRRPDYVDPEDRPLYPPDPD